MDDLKNYQSIVVGSGPNGLAAAITLARAGRSVVVLEGRDTPGGGMRTADLTLPGFKQDICSTVQSLGLASSFMRSLPLEEWNVEWIHPPLALAHPFDDGKVAVLDRSVETTAAGFGVDGQAYTRLIQPLVNHWEDLIDDLLGPLPLPPKHPITLMGFGLNAICPADGFARRMYRGEAARAVFGGLAAHAMLPLENAASAAFGLMLNTLVHAVGFPIVGAGSQTLADAMAGYFRSLGGEIRTGIWVSDLDGLPAGADILLDVTPRQVADIAGKTLPENYLGRLRKYRYGPGVFKLDYALAAPIPWKAEACSQAGTLHLGNTLEEISACEQTVWQGKHPEKPFVILVQPTPFDPSRAPRGKHTAWAYCHVPAGSTKDMTPAIEQQIERFAPGFRKNILARHSYTATEMESYNPNYVGGDINGGVQDLHQLYARPVSSLSPYSTPNRHIYFCSSSTPPGGGVHGMCGYHAALAILKKGNRTI
jgi:phytoene dehydrogenase-like protein